MRVVVVGGGIIGLATARLLARTREDADVVLLEKEQVLARHQTGHNSGVAHAGLVLRARLVEGTAVPSRHRSAARVLRRAGAAVGRLRQARGRDRR